MGKREPGIQMRVRNQQSSEEQQFSPVLQKKMKTKEDRQEKIRVVVRCRPLNKKERNANGRIVTDINERSGEIKIGLKSYNFDKVFGPRSDQVGVYHEVVEPVVKEVLDGYSCTIFAYGQTGTGKTFTMEGERSDGDFTWENDPKSGIIPRTMNHLFDALNASGNEFTVQVSLIEIYNEEIMDLLSTAQTVEKLKMYDDTKGGIKIKGMSEVTVKNKDDIYEIMERGSLKRKVAATEMNAHSSRSHCVFQIQINMKVVQEDKSGIGEEYIRQGKLYLVDLAGSENVGRSGAQHARAREAGNINQSLLALGRVITGLVEGSPHIPYRESKLTRLLQDSLGGPTKTSIIATISPSSCSQEETLSTLDYARRAKNIKNKPTVNQAISKRALIKQYVEQIDQLNAELNACREQNGVYLDPTHYERMKEDLESLTKDKEARQIMDEKIDKEINSLKELLDETQQQLEATNAELGETKEELKTTQFVGKERYSAHLRSWQQGKRLHGRLEQAETEVEQLHAKGDVLLGKQERNTTRLTDLRLDHNSGVSELQAFLTESQATLNKEVDRVENDSSTMLMQVEKATSDAINTLDAVGAKSIQSKIRTLGLIEAMSVELKTLETGRHKQLVSQMKHLHESVAELQTHSNALHTESANALASLATTAKTGLGQIVADIGAMRQFTCTIQEGTTTRIASIIDSLNDNVQTEQSDDDKLLEMVLQLNTRVHEKLTTRRQERESRSSQMHTLVTATGQYTQDSLQKLSRDSEAPVIAIKQEETKNERAFQETLAKGEKELTGVINSHAEDLQSGLTAFGANTKEETIATRTSISNFTNATTTAFSAHVKVIDDAQASIASLADVVDEHELSTYDADGESPQKRERLDTSTILQVESDAEIRERKVPSRETTLDDNNSLDQSNQDMDTENNKSLESVESNDEGVPIVQLSEYNARESVGIPLFQAQRYKAKRNKRQRVVDNESDQENQLPRPNC